MYGWIEAMMISLSCPICRSATFSKDRYFDLASDTSYPDDVSSCVISSAS